MYYCMKIMSKQRIVDLKQQDHVRAERQVLSMVRHPFLCSLFSSFQDEFNLYIVMDYIQGGELFAHIRASASGLAPDVVRFYGAEIVLALEYLHSFKIVHRDLKPENLLLDKRGHIRLVDFGFAKVRLVVFCFILKCCRWLKTRHSLCVGRPSTLRVRLSAGAATAFLWIIGRLVCSCTRCWPASHLFAATQTTSSLRLFWRVSTRCRPTLRPRLLPLSLACCRLTQRDGSAP
jgi:serine/threonine protein kinase